MSPQKNVDPETLPYRDCVGIAVFNKSGQVWVGRRLRKKGDETTGETKCWQMPQGGIDEGEKPLDAAYRELWEETGMRSIELVQEADGWFTYDLPRELVGVTWKGKYRGQKQKWFAVLFTGDESEIAIDPPPEGNHAEFDEWIWVDLEELPRIVVPFKQAVYEDIVRSFRPVVNKLRQD